MLVDVPKYSHKLDHHLSCSLDTKLSATFFAHSQQRWSQQIHHQAVPNVTRTWTKVVHLGNEVDRSKTAIVVVL